MNKKVIVGRFGSVHGIRGWLKVHSFTEPRENIIQYLPWLIETPQGWQDFTPADSQSNKHTILVKPSDCESPEQARFYVNKLIAVNRNILPALHKDEYYWTDLEGLQVVNQQGALLGIIDHLFATGSNDVMVVKGDKEHLIPYISEFILEIDLIKGQVIVDWDSEF